MPNETRTSSLDSAACKAEEAIGDIIRPLPTAHRMASDNVLGHQPVVSWDRRV